MNLVWQELHLATNGLSGDQLDDQGRQCLACQKRGTKCDSAPISCLRCLNDNIECPGYAKPLHETCSRNSERRRNGQNNGRPSKSAPTSLQLVLSATQETTDWVALLESIKYYNLNVLPQIKPAHLPYRRQNIETTYWNLIPPILRYLWIVNIGAIQAGRSNIDPLANSSLVQYRGRSLSELQKLMMDVPEAVNDPYGVALYSILFLMGAEIQISGPRWSSHLEAARRIIALKGGLGICFELFPPPTHVPLMTFIMADTITATTCPARLLTTAFVQTQFECLKVLPSIELELIANGYSYPLPLLLAIVQINIVRSQLYYNTEEDGHPESLQYDCSRLLQSVQIFDTQQWASRVSTFGRAQPEPLDSAISVSSMICLASLAHCYKSATILYLVLSTSPSLAFPDLQLRQTIHTARHTLEQHLCLLFEQSHNKTDPGCDGPLHTQLWKFVTWPLFVSVYVRAARGTTHSVTGSQRYLARQIDSEEAMDRDMRHLRAISIAMGARNLHLEKLVSRVQQARTADAIKGIETPWIWDNGFSERLVFAV